MEINPTHPFRDQPFSPKTSQPVRPWKWIVGRCVSFPFEMTYVQGPMSVFREGNMYLWKIVGFNSNFSSLGAPIFWSTTQLPSKKMLFTKPPALSASNGLLNSCNHRTFGFSHGVVFGFPMCFLNVFLWQQVTIIIKFGTPISQANL